MADTRVGGGSFEAIIATLEKLTEAIDLLNQVDDQRAAQLASLEAAQAELRREIRHLNIKYDALREATSATFDRVGSRLDALAAGR